MSPITGGNHAQNDFCSFRSRSSRWLRGCPIRGDYHTAVNDRLRTGPVVSRVPSLSGVPRRADVLRAGVVRLHQLQARTPAWLVNGQASLAPFFGGARFFIFRGTIDEMQKEIKTLIELGEEAGRFVETLAPKGADATLVTLSGELGAGKTAFVKAVAHALGVEDVVTSPTFVLEKIYSLSNNSFKRLVHIDAYRLEKGADLAPLGFDELMQDAGNLILLEWPEKVADALPIPAVCISIVSNSDDSRMITYG